MRITQDDEVITPFNSGSPCDSVIETIWEFCFYLPEYEDWLCFTEYACVSKSEVIDPGGDDGGGDPVDPVDPGEPGGGTPPVGDDDDPCDEFGGGEDDDGEGDNGGGHDNDEGFAPRMIECNECNFPNPPAGCPVDEDEEAEIEPCETGFGFIDDLTIQQVLQTLWENSNYGNRENPNPESQRLEQGGYLIPNPWGEGYHFQPISEGMIIQQNNCWFEFETVPDLP